MNVDLSQNYEIIHDPSQVIEFLKIFIPENVHNVMEISLFSRRKYCSRLSKSEYILHRVLIDGTNEDKTSPNYTQSALRKLYRLHVPVGSFVDDNGAIPQESLALYALLTPKSPLRAMSKVLTKCLDDVMNGNPVPRPHKKLIAEISRTDAVGQQQYSVIDLDSKDENNVETTKEVIKKANLIPYIKLCTETKNGYHIIFEKNSKIDRKMLYEFKKDTMFYKKNRENQNAKDYWFSISGSAITVVPGTYQGGFKTKLCNDLFIS